MIAELCLYRTNYLADLSRKYRLIELGNHLTLAEFAKVTALRIGGAGGKFLRGILKIDIPCGDFVHDILCFFFGIHQDMLCMYGFALFKMLGIFFVERLHFFICYSDILQNAVDGKLGKDILSCPFHHGFKFIGFIHFFFFCHLCIQMECQKLLQCVLSELGICRIRLLFLRQIRDICVQIRICNVYAVNCC